MAAKNIESQRGKEKFVDDENYIYDFHMHSADKIKSFWRCEMRKSSCLARIHTKIQDGENEIVKKINSHNHSSTLAKVEARTAVSEIKRRIQKGDSSSTRMILAETVNKLDENGKSEISSLPTISRSITNWRSKAFGAPPLPQTRTGFEIPQSFRVLSDGKTFLQSDSGIDDEKRILVFASDKGLNDLQSSRYLGMDGTFKVSPSEWYQVLIVHAYIHGKVFPRAFILLPDKSENTYDKAFTILKELMPNLNPKEVMVDFEKGLGNSIKKHFPCCETVGCFFHMCQSVYRRICDLGLKCQYNTDNNFSLLIRMFCALAFLPTEEVTEAFEELSENELLPMEFISYFELTYIGAIRGRRRRREAPLYPITFWNMRSRVMNKLPRTNNALEGFHSALNQSLACKNPNIWKFIDVLKKEEALTETKILHLQLGEQPVKKKKYEKLDNCIVKLTEEYDGSNQSDFLKAIAYNLKSF